MHEISKRQHKLLRLLLEQKGFLPVNHFSKILSISGRTLYKDIDELNKALKKRKIEILKRQGKGIFLSKSDLSNDEILKIFGEASTQIDFNQLPLERQIKMAEYLLLRNKKVSYQLLSDEFLVSRTSISNDLDQIQTVIEGCSATIRSDNNGTKVDGNESEIQKAIKQYAYFIIDKSDLTNSYRVQFPSLLFSFLPKDIIKKVSGLLQTNDHFNIDKLSDDHFQSLVLSISIFVLRLQEGFHIEHQDNFLFENVESLKTFFLANELVENLELDNSIKLDSNDFEYLNRQLVAHGFEPRLRDLAIQKEYDAVVRKMIQEMSDSIQVDLTRDEKLYMNILYHLVSMIYRSKLNVPVNNPLLEEIKREYSVLYSTTWLILAGIEKELDIRLTDDEVAFMMIHFQGAIDRLSANRKILIVCPTGIGTSELIANRLKRVFSPQDIVEVVSLRTLYKRDLNKIDLVISSVQLEKIDVPVTYVSPLMSKQDLKKVSATYLDLFYEEEVNDQPFEHLGKIIDSDLIFLNETVATKEQCIKRITQKLLQNDFVTDSFEQAIWDREKLGVTDLPTGAAIPHPSPSTVKESKLVIMTLVKPIRWNFRMINTVLMICVAEKDLKHIKGILSEIYRIVETKKNIDRFIFSKDEEEIVKVLGGQTID
ncbi:BglG family transcription antiterminator [Enterococcus hulanensis]|uniref:BglG family transcription antiterminator n=1 Tax=Enterococcus hulanensis TaxID=2559929 RepID=A0ABU3EXG5_9ENTE|nr:BglG family transcription antiterminator [Enterococcus hulanensis]MDT2599564.1 BglG family transcription antiterminator [Enterococcus hulanensis]MDT2609580.1 BglG family transcription antiterminator [Enterococcus hulanensis]MDT2616157.1 BglG family transcription antiterminator [Enterococcus hulanensis]MDT2627803.1 BglG family transcription antiterminator [Enterococcus hulanensis]MDT2654908.1 BglG family transcription antiterminator [Enterococcus hulanensis]